MIRRLVVLLAAALVLSWWLRRLLDRVSAARRPSSARGTERRAEPMVRDRVCNTFLPRSRALIERVGSEERFFCSERCRGAFLAERAAGQG